jgi:hypothetical protein
MGGATGIRTRKKHPDKALNVLAIRAIEKPGRYADGNGLYLKVDPSGAKRWELRTVVRGKRCDIGLGGLRAVTLAEAREQPGNTAPWPATTKTRSPRSAGPGRWCRRFG